MTSSPTAAPGADARHARRSYQQFCPLARALDLLGERWTLLVVRDLFLGPTRFSDLRDHLPGMAPALLTQRLRDLEAAGLVQRTYLPPPAARTVYELTERGRALEPVVYELARFGAPYLADPTDAQFMPHLMPMGVKTMVVVEALPRRAFGVQLVLEEGYFTLRVAGEQRVPAISRVSLEPGLTGTPHVVVRGSALAMMAVKQGEMSFDAARRGKKLHIDGPKRAIDETRALFGLG